MKEIKNFIKPVSDNFNEKEYVQSMVDYENSIEGNRNLEDGYDCPKCKNRGYYSFVNIVGGRYQEASKDCECKFVRKALKSLKYSGLSPEKVANSNFDNYKTTYEWQKILKNTALDYLNNFKKENSWFYLSGQSGAGKTMLMTALFKELVIKHSLNCKYMLWNSEIKNLIAGVRRNSEDTAMHMFELKTVDLLYIDDFLKLSGAYITEELSIAYEILNTRYENNLPTLISSEVMYEDLENLDGAVAGRIYEMTQNGKYLFGLVGNEKNIRKNTLK